MMLLTLLPSAFALTLSLQSEDNPYTGIVIQHYRASNPATDVTVALIDLCASSIHVDATTIEDAYQTTGSWASSVGAQLAINADFHRTWPNIFVYGDAVGNGVQWPLINTGLDSSQSGEWFYQKYGWIAFTHDKVMYTHTKWVKDNSTQFGGSLSGWQPTQVAPSVPPGTLALISGFSQLVIDGQVYTCSSSTAPDCFPDRTDMRTRHPRTAVGLTADFETLILVTVDGRTTTNLGMYGAELAEVMGQLGAYFALNVDGGGSTQMWLDGSYINSPSETYRTVANHLGVFAGSNNGKPQRAGHCASQDPCQIIPPAGDIIDDESTCFQGFGDPQYWRNESVGYDGSLHWTNAFSYPRPVNWAWWQLWFEEAGEYEVFYYATPDYAVYDQVSHRIMAAGTEHDLTVDQSTASGWTSLGTYQFDAGGEQFVALYDNQSGSVASNQHIVADAIQVTRVGEWCGDGLCNNNEDCQTCAQDCTQEAEIPDNGIDDDCDGQIDTPESEPASEPADDPQEDLCEGYENQIWCVDSDMLASCTGDQYAESSCFALGQLCSSALNSCIDSICEDRENESWCDDLVAHECMMGQWDAVDCSLSESSCQDGSCIPLPQQPTSNNELETTSEPSKDSQCGAIGIFSWTLIMLSVGRLRFSQKSN